MSFEARYAGKCWVCGEWFDPGTQITYHEEATIHAGCELAAMTEQAKEQSLLESMCQKCWQIPSASGACGCDA